MKVADGKKIILSFAILLITLFMSGNQFAEGFSVISVNGNTSTESMDEFSLNDTPWLYISIPEVEDVHGTTALWKSEQNSYFFTSYMGADNNIYFSLDNWDSIKTPGEWNVGVTSMQFIEGSYQMTSNSTSFTVTPEPMSYVLFLVGGGALAGRHFWSSRKNA